MSREGLLLSEETLGAGSDTFGLSLLCLILNPLKKPNKKNLQQQLKKSVGFRGLLQILRVQVKIRFMGEICISVRML